MHIKKYLKNLSGFLGKRVGLVVGLSLVVIFAWGGVFLYNSIYKKQALTEPIISKKKINQKIYQELTEDLEKAQINIDRAMSKEYPDPFK